MDILPHVIEEAYLEANPAARPARAFLIMCGEGDLSGIVELLHVSQEDCQEGGNVMSPVQLLHYQDPIDEMKSGLHVAIEKEQPEVVWLLLWLASDLPEEQFPLEAIHAASELNTKRLSRSSEADIRSLQNRQGQSAEELAKAIGGHWNLLINSGILSK